MILKKTNSTKKKLITIAHGTTKPVLKKIRCEIKNDETFVEVHCKCFKEKCSSRIPNFGAVANLKFSNITWEPVNHEHFFTLLKFNLIITPRAFAVRNL